MRTIKRFLIVALPLSFAGCADSVPVQPVKITGSDMCRIQPSPLTWDVKDTAPTITGIRQFNARWTSRCGKKSRGAPVS